MFRSFRTTAHLHATLDNKTRSAGLKTPALIGFSAVYVSSLLVLLFVFIISCAIDGVIHGGSTLFTSIWRPEEGHFGILPMLSATTALSVSSLLLGWCITLGVVSFIHGFGSRRAAACLHSLLRTMTAMPTVVYGFASVFLLAPVIRDALGGTGFSWLTATLLLALLITPTMSLTISGAVEQLMKESSVTAEALGFSRAEQFVYIALPAAKKWLFSAALLGFGRACGDTMIPTMLAGNAVQHPCLPSDAIRTLTAHIGLVMSSDVGGTAYYSLFVSGGILLIVCVAANLLFRFSVKAKMKKTDEMEI